MIWSAHAREQVFLEHTVYHLGEPGRQLRLKLPVGSRHGLITSVAYRLGSQAPVYCLEGSIAVAGALVQWLRDNLGLIETAAEVEPLAAGVEDSGGAYIVPAFSGLFAPYWRADARGVIVGLTRYVTKGHLARAVLEAVAFQACDIVSARVRQYPKKQPPSGRIYS